VRICGYFLKPKGVHKQKSLGHTALTVFFFNMRIKDSGLLGHDAVSLGDQVPMFEKIVVPLECLELLDQ
jgi:hypothetical protein